MNNSIVKSEVVDLSTFNNQDSGFSIEEFKQIIVRRWKSALAVAVVSSTGMFLFSALQTPQYLSETQILIDSSKTEQSTSVAPNSTSTTSYHSINDLSTEILILRSNSMVAKALATIKNRYPALSVGEILGKLNIYQASINKTPTDALVVSYTDKDPERAKVVVEALGSTYVKYSLDKQRSQATNAIQFIDTQLGGAQQELDDAAKAIRQFRQINHMVDPESSATTVAGIKLSVEQQIQQTKIALQLNKQQTQELERLLKELGQDSETMLASSVLGQDGVYQNLATQLKEVETQYNLGKLTYHDTYHVMEDLKDRRKELKRLIHERAEQVLGKSISPAILDRIVLSQANLTSSSSSSTVDTSAANSSNTQDSSTDTSTTNSSNTQNSSANNSENSSFSSPQLPTNIFSQPNIGTSNSDSQVSGSKISAEGSTLSSLANRRLQLQQEAATLQSKLESLTSTKAEVATNFEQIPSLQQTYAELQRQLKLKSSAYDYLLERKQELEITAAEETAPWRILNDPFLPSKPISPDIPQALLTALIGGGFLGLATAFVLQKMDQRIQKVEEIKELTKLPILGVVPKVDDPTVEVNIPTTKRSYSYYSSFTEGFRSLAMNLRYLMIESGRIKTLAITSSTSAEGKTTLTYNLGIILSEFDLRVLIVDGDMRKPKIHKLAKLDNETGLSDAITTEQPWSDFIQTTTFENLDFITSGQTSPNPIALLNSNKMEQLIEEWREAYDYVLIDTPPVGVIADAKSLASQVDTILFVAGIERVNRKSIGNALDILRSSQCNIAGIVANMVNPDFDYYAYSYYDSYYNQSSQNGSNNDDEDRGSEGRLSNILEQFRRH